MSDTTKSLRPLVNRPACWESEHEAIITFFTDDGDVWGFLSACWRRSTRLGSESNAGAAVARRSSANPRAACARLLHSIRERERDRHQSEGCGYPFGATDPASLPPPPRRNYRQWAINKKSARLGEAAGSFASQFFPCPAPTRDVRLPHVRRLNADARSWAPG